MSSFENQNPSQIDYQTLNKLKVQHEQKIWAIGGGKGGVGKSLITANLSIYLALMGHKVISIDLDLGGANLHTCLGIPIPEFTLSDYLSKKVNSIHDIITPSPIPNLSIISGAQDEMGMANLKSMHRSKLLSKISSIDADFVLFDLGAGTTNNTLDFFISSDLGILTVLPEPTSIENTYRFIKSVYHRRLNMIEELMEFRPIIDKALNSKISDSHESPISLISKIYTLNKEVGQKLSDEISRFRPLLIMNQVRNQNDIDIGHSMKSICKKYFGIDLEYIGHLDYDPAVWQSVKKRRPLLMEYPNSKLAINFDRIIQKLLNI